MKKSTKTTLKSTTKVVVGIGLMSVGFAMIIDGCKDAQDADFYRVVETEEDLPHLTTMEDILDEIDENQDRIPPREAAE